MGTLRRMDKTGDGTVIEWNEHDSKSVANAKKTFEALRTQGFDFWNMTAERDRGAPFRGDFDPKVGLLLASPRMAGG